MKFVTAIIEVKDEYSAQMIATNLKRDYRADVLIYDAKNEVEIQCTTTNTE